MKMYTLFMALQLYNQILCRAIHYLFPCAVLTVTFSIIFSLYVTIVGTALPFYLHILFPVVAVLSLTMNSILAIDATKVANLSVNAIELIKSYDHELSVLLGKSVTSYYRKQELALRQVRIQNGSFGSIKPNLPLKIMEQTMNQLLLLLSF